MLYKITIKLFGFFLCFFILTVINETRVFASVFEERLIECNNKKEVKIQCYNKLVSSIISKLKKECDSQYKNLTTKLKGHKRVNFSKAQDYCIAGNKINCFKELAKKAKKQFDYYEETGYCK